MPIVTYENVAEAARALESRGDRVSVRKIMAELGGGSPNQITPLVAQYKAEKPSIQKPTIPLDPRIQDLIVRQIEVVAADAAKAADERAADASADVELLAETGRVAETRIQELTQELDEARGKAAQDIAAITLERDKAETLATERQTEIARLQELLGREQAAAEDARVKVAKAQLTIEGQKKDIETKDDSLKSLKQELDEVRAAKDKAAKDLAVAEALAQVSGQTIKDEKQKNLDIQKQVDELRLAKEKVDTELTQEKSKAAAAESALKEKKELVEELRGQVSMVSAERDRLLVDKSELTAERDRIRDAYKTQGETSKRREAELRGEIEELKQRFQDTLGQQRTTDPKKIVNKNGGRMESAPADA